MSVRISESVLHRFRDTKFYFQTSGPTLVCTIPIATVAADQVPLTANDALMIEWRVLALDVGGPMSGGCRGGCVVRGGAPAVVDQVMTNANQSGPGVIGIAAINGAGDLEIYSFGGGAGSPANAEGFLEITGAELLSLQ
jgi:hypothetical protein